MQKSNYIIVVPGLGDDLVTTSFWTNRWHEEDHQIEIWSAHWADKSDTFEQKYQRLYAYIKKLKKNGNTISLVGISAGSSLVCSVFAKNPKLIHKIVNICGRLRMAKTGLPTLERITFRIPAFQESVRAFESIEPKITPDMRTRIMTFSGIYDELVPVSTIPLEGAENRYVPFIGHNTCIVLALTLYRSRILDFIKS